MNGSQIEPQTISGRKIRIENQQAEPLLAKNSPEIR